MTRRLDGAKRRGIFGQNSVLADLVYLALDIDYEDTSGADRTGFDMAFAGLNIGYTFNL